MVILSSQLAIYSFFDMYTQHIEQATSFSLVLFYTTAVSSAINEDGLPPVYTISILLESPNF